MSVAHKRIAWTDEMLRLEALKYETRDEFQKGNNGAYQAARRRGRKFFKGICSHMPNRKDISGDKNPHFKWSHKKLQKEALKYKTMGEFQKGSPGAYMTAYKRGILEQICIHMIPRDFLGASNPNYRWTDEELILEALKYQTIVDFQKNSGAAYQAAWNRGILIKICSHMRPAHGSSVEEKQIMATVKEFFSSAKKTRTKRINIANRSYIKMFELDIFIPELNLAIEYDGDYWHSYEVMRASKSKKKWPNSAIRNYHKIKDDYFASIGITVLHIKECDWKDDKTTCLAQIEKFLGVTGFMSENELKAA